MQKPDLFQAHAPVLCCPNQITGICNERVPLTFPVNGSCVYLYCISKCSKRFHFHKLPVQSSGHGICSSLQKQTLKINRQCTYMPVVFKVFATKEHFPHFPILSTFSLLPSNTHTRCCRRFWRIF